MVKHRILTVILISLMGLSLITGCNTKPESTETSVTPTTPTQTTTTTQEAAWYQGVVDGMKALDIGEFPEHLRQESGSKNGTEFNVNEYFKALPNLSMEEGYVLDWVYYYNGSAGEPIIYVRAESQKPYTNYEEYATAMLNQEGMDEAHGIVTPLWNEQSGVFEDKIRIDGTEEGFFEYAVLQVAGGQFYLFWHANYNDWEIVCAQDKLDEIIEDRTNSSFGKDMLPEVAKEARKLDCKPIIAFKDDTATVSVVVFTKWGGFKRLTYTIKQEYPHTIIDVQTETLVEYHCGVMF